MSDRERKRAELQKRKRRGAERVPAPAAAPQPAEPSKSEQRDAEARAALEPLHEGERPAVLTIAAVISALIAAGTLIAYLAGAKVSGERPPVTAAIVPAGLLGVMAWGLWRTRYWAVLGFQTLLVILILATALGLVSATMATQLIGNVVVLAISGVLFYFMIKAMARVQMPQRRPRE